MGWLLPAILGNFTGPYHQQEKTGIPDPGRHKYFSADYRIYIVKGNLQVSHELTVITEENSRPYISDGSHIFARKQARGENRRSYRNRPSSHSEAVTASADGNWGLSFQEGKSLVANASMEELETVRRLLLRRRHSALLHSV